MATLEEKLQASSLFRGISTADMGELLAVYRPIHRSYTKGQAVLLAGDLQREIGIVTAGALLAEKTTPSGERQTFTHLEESDVFGDVLSGSHAVSPVTLTALTATEVFFFPYERLFEKNRALSPAASSVLHNLISSISDKYFAQSRRLDLLAIHRLPERIMAFLQEEAARAKSAAFSLSFDREGMAAYLNCDRSALSRALSQLRAAGAIRFSKRQFEITPPKNT